MGCCSSFSAALPLSVAEPSRHVNFTTGMVLGVDDYVQEFAYHSARDKWIVRDGLGYGTLAGLAVTVEEDGANGPRVRVTRGSAATPSGQLICVGRDQCGGLNAWLASGSAVADALQARLTLDPAALTQRISLYVTLCYTDCAVAEVPIPGEPCRSAENLMAPSRIADDYCLEFRLDPPPMREAQALDALGALHASLDIAAGNPGDAAGIADAIRMAGIQLGLALGLPNDGTAPSADDLAAIQLDPAAVPAFDRQLKRLWVTRVRPAVLAQLCAGPADPANDCVLLARLDLPIQRVDPASVWTTGATSTVSVDESERPILIGGMAAQTAVGATLSAAQTGRAMQILTGDGTVTLAQGLVIVRSDTASAVTLPAAPAATLGNMLTIKAAGDGVATLGVTGTTRIDGGTSLALAVRGAATLVSDGDDNWHLVSQLGGA